MRNSQIEVRPIAGTIGAEIHNVDVSQELDEATIGDIRKASARSKDLVGQILVFSRIERTKRELLDLRTVIRDAVSQFNNTVPPAASG